MKKFLIGVTASTRLSCLNKSTGCNSRKTTSLRAVFNQSNFLSFPYDGGGGWNKSAGMICPIRRPVGLPSPTVTTLPNGTCLERRDTAGFKGWVNRSARYSCRNQWEFHEILLSTERWKCIEPDCSKYIESDELTETRDNKGAYFGRVHLCSMPAEPALSLIHI